ncbi:MULTISPECIES: gamma-glutamyltransferase family protein [Virgibacillus]|uniref:Gamma-glutamyltransferase YwrD n=1 Tax=Virgibacillus dokdonensis TaxID=302167 RepID=A0A2K9IUA1_9BACI|nr:MULTISPECIES: gamma-glutamyltransferase family protein [Virgibacillus]AUJ23369.1 Putative gamma-glutamyltransferase YwrD [Virgibacillus dokdonensis]NWO12819.1 gamma-glutamyltransferase family protein [Virgibacillus sp.]
MEFFQRQTYPYAVPRQATYAKKGMVATSQPLAAQAGLEILKQGGNAIDAAIATAACLTVVEPTSNGIGGDAFALVWTKGKLHGLNASGKSPQHISVDAVKELGYKDIPEYGWIPVTVPGAPSAWAELSKKFGKLSLQEVLKPAIHYAYEGFPVSPILSRFWKKAYQVYEWKLTDDLFKEWFTTFAPKGKAPAAGEIWYAPNHGTTLQEIADSYGESFYRGELAERIHQFSKQSGGFLTNDDLASYYPEWVEPIHVKYRGYSIWEIPPNGQGIIALQALNILKGFHFEEKDHVETYHKQIEAMKLAFADGQKHVSEPLYMRYSVSELLSEEYGALRRGLIGDHALQPEAGEPALSGTVYLATADQEGNMVSFIQSNYMGFGSGIVVPGTGIALQNRGHNFSMDPSHVNVLAGGKRTYHTIIPGFMTKDNQPVGPFGVMGGFMQPQGHVQVIMNTLDFQMNPQVALDAPRWQWIKDKQVEVEDRFPHHIALELAEKGHRIQVQLEPNNFGRGQIIWRNPDTGVLIGGTESRADGTIAAW